MHLSAGLILNQAERSDPAADGLVASGCFPCRFAEGNDVSLTLHCCADDLLGIVVKLSRLLGHQVRGLLFQLPLFFPELLVFATFLGLGLRTER